MNTGARIYSLFSLSVALNKLKLSRCLLSESSFDKQNRYLIEQYDSLEFDEISFVVSVSVLAAETER